MCTTKRVTNSATKRPTKKVFYAGNPNSICECRLLDRVVTSTFR